MLVAPGSNVSTPAIPAAATTALSNFNITAPKFALTAEKQGEEPADRYAGDEHPHSEGFSANNLPSLIT